MIKLAIYGKGGIGKSTCTANLAAAFASLGKRVIQIGCDPKADSTINLLGGTPVTPVMDYMRDRDEEPTSIEEISQIGFGGILCIETGGPTPGLGCAGRGIITTFSLLEELELFEKFKPDVVLYDVLGDVVCGGFAAPIIEDRSYAKVRGIIMNRRAVENEEEKVRAFAESAGLDVAADIPRSADIIKYEDMGKTVIEGDPECETSKRFFDLAKKLIAEEEQDD